MKNRRRFILEILLFLLVLIVAIIHWINDYKNDQEIQSNSAVTEGVIIDYEIVGPDNHYRTYEYYVEGSVFRNRIIPAIIFKNCKKTKECIGQKFKVYYSTKNPEKSRIDLTQEIE